MKADAQLQIIPLRRDPGEFKEAILLANQCVARDRDGCRPAMVG
jgi:hypothetical protein